VTARLGELAHVQAAIIGGFTKDEQTPPLVLILITDFLRKRIPPSTNRYRAGSETEEQFRAISKLGGEEVQGCLFRPPRPAEEARWPLARFGGPPHPVRATE
jgi:hypothetical protein